MGIFGLALNIILLFISGLIPCGKDQYARNFCSSIKDVIVKEENNSLKMSIYYFDNFFSYIFNIKNEYPKDII